MTVYGISENSIVHLREKMENDLCCTLLKMATLHITSKIQIQTKK